MMHTYLARRTADGVHVELVPFTWKFVGDIMRQEVRTRLYVLLDGLVSALFWTVAVIAISQVIAAGHVEVLLLVGIPWIILSLPCWYVQLSIVLDLVGFLLTGKQTFYHDIRRRGSADRAISSGEVYPGTKIVKGSKQDRLRRFIVNATSMTSPIAALSTWAFYQHFQIDGVRALKALLAEQGIVERRPAITPVISDGEPMRHQKDSERYVFDRAAARLVHA